MVKVALMSHSKAKSEWLWKLSQKTLIQLHLIIVKTHGQILTSE